MKKIEYDKNLGIDLLNFRLKHNKSRTEIAYKLGVCERSVYRWEQGEHLPKSQYIRRKVKKLIRNGSR